MSWTLLVGAIVVLGIALLVTASRRAELMRMERAVRERDQAIRQGSDKGQLQHPVIDLSRCLGCATCVAVCPEDGVLDIVHGQAMVVNGSRCVGVSACERECPVGALTVTMANLEDRNDIPALSEGLEAVGSRGLFLAGEVTAHALIKNAIEQGTAVAAEVARRDGELEPAEKNGVLDLCVVGAGPAGLACSLEAKRHGLHFVTLDQASAPGGTVAKYPRRKLVLSDPVDLPLYGPMKNRTYSKEELIAIWQGIAVEQQLPIVPNEVFGGLDRDANGNFLVRTEENTYAARNVCLALGRRGIPRQLGVEGEELSKVSYALLDAGSYTGRRILVVGGGDSAVETAMGLAEQPGNEVTLSYRQEAFFRMRSRNEVRLQASMEQNKLQVLLQSRVLSIRSDAVDVAVMNGDGNEHALTLPNDDVFVMAGGVPPFQLLERSGVSFDASQRAPQRPLVEQGTGLVKALAIGFAFSLIALIWAVWHGDYYLLARPDRPAHGKHELLRPSMGIGLTLGIVAAVLIILNLLYLWRRAPTSRFKWGSLQTWMTSHIATGILAFLFALLHGAMTPRDTVGGDAFWALTALLVTGGIGRYFYAYVPRAANGRELELEEVKARMSQASDDWDSTQRKFQERARKEVLAVIEARQWTASFLGRIVALIGGQRDLRRVLARLADQGRMEGIPEDQIKHMTRLARGAHRTALIAAHYEDVRAVLNSWRYLHRWVAALMVLLVIVHIVYSLFYRAAFSTGGGA